jgi:hypothetical protein
MKTFQLDLKIIAKNAILNCMFLIKITKKLRRERLELSHCDQ